MSEKANRKNPLMTGKNNGLAERIIDAEDMKRYKNAMDNSRSYISGDEQQSSSSHQFTKKP
ncbi:MAG: hypothetical protein GX237_05155 [Clostridiales bacterium]|nr:hypothetical protein [Clostridiales bacterium]